MPEVEERLGNISQNSIQFISIILNLFNDCFDNKEISVTISVRKQLSKQGQTGKLVALLFYLWH
jgi:hypothetical protein